MGELIQFSDHGLRQIEGLFESGAIRRGYQSEAEHIIAAFNEGEISGTYAVALIGGLSPKYPRTEIEPGTQVVEAQLTGEKVVYVRAKLAVVVGGTWSQVTEYAAEAEKAVSDAIGALVGQSIGTASIPVEVISAGLTR